MQGQVTEPNDTAPPLRHFRWDCRDLRKSLRTAVRTASVSVAWNGDRSMVCAKHAINPKRRLAIARYKMRGNGES